MFEDLLQVISYNSNKYRFITAHKRTLQRLCFYTCQSFCSQGGLHPGGGGVCIQGEGGLHPWRDICIRGSWADPLPPPSDRTLRDRVNKRAVRIILKCILVFFVFFFGGGGEAASCNISMAWDLVSISKLFM